MHFRVVLCRAIAFCARALLRLRYKVTITGEELFKGKKLDSSTLVLPNHSAEIDPIILFSFLMPHIDFSPTVIEHFYYYPGMKIFNKLLRAIPVPVFDHAVNKLKLASIVDCQKTIIQRLKSGGNVIIYPSGRLKLHAMEDLGGASLVHKICQELPSVNMLLVRITGLWGSSFSKAFCEASPDFWAVLGGHFKSLLRNAIFFSPRRQVLIELEVPKNDFPKHATRYVFNRALEDWYNQYPVNARMGGKRVVEEPLFFVKYRRFGHEDVQKVVTRHKSLFPSLDEIAIHEQVKERMLAEIARMSKKQISEISPEHRLAQDLGFDSLDSAELFVYLQKHFEIDHTIEPYEIQNVSDLLVAAHGVSPRRAPGKVKEAIASKEKKRGWQKERTPSTVIHPVASNLLEAFLKTADRMKDAEAAADPTVDSISYKKMKLAIALLRKKFLSFEGQYVGVMLPSSVGAVLIYFALIAAGKTPIFLNWTTGARALDHMVDLLDLKEVITSRKFIDRLHDVEFGKVGDLLLMMENIKSKISLGDKLRAFWESSKPALSLLRDWNLDGLSGDDIAIVLMTSGTSKLPKAVPLSHKNILHNIRGMISAVNLHESEVVFSMLPAFHSFGFTVAAITPLVIGARVCFYPDPKDPTGILSMIERYKPTLLPGAPTFLQQILRNAKPHQLDSVQMLVTGAETASAHFLKEAKEKLKTGALIVEGYGCTECSPVITVNRVDKGEKEGIGLPLDSYEVVLLDPETMQPVGHSHRGLLCVRGPSVFAGYLGLEESPFIEINGKPFYNTGDLVSMTPRGNFIIHGRLKRFAKIGGEMVSLVAIEDVLNDFAKHSKMRHFKDDKLDMAVIAREQAGGKTQLILFSRLDIELAQVNAILREKGGFSNLIKITQVVHIDEIPVNAGGKVVFGKLEEKAKGLSL